ncbi:hypothetical protein BGZ76_002713 [Entomortierella beljakovae]|nr:hypothetical protein BGZ76_002713 [Entomortierella beljakovae]
MSSRNANHRVPSSKYNNHDSSRNNAIMVNNDIMILHGHGHGHGNQRSTPSETEEDYYQTAAESDNSLSHSNTPDSLSLEQLPLPPTPTISTIPQLASSPSSRNPTGTVSNLNPNSPYQTKNTSNQQYNHQSNNSITNTTSNNNNSQHPSGHEMKVLGQNQCQSKTRSPTLSSSSTTLTSKTLDATAVTSLYTPRTPNKDHPTKSNANKNKQNSRKVRGNDFPESGITNTNKRSSGLSSILGRFKNGKPEPEPELIIGTLNTQSAYGSKNNLIYDQSEQYEHTKSNSNSGNHHHKQSGVPGKNGEEPETDMFNFVNIMLSMPEKPTWREVIIKLLKVLVVMAISYLALMALYFAAEYNSEARLKNFGVLVVDLDQGIIGVNYINFTRHLNDQHGQINWSIGSIDAFPNISTIQEQVANGNYWGAVVVQPNASSNLNKAFAIPLPDYDPTKAFAFIYEGGRDPLVVKPYIVANMYTQFLFFSKIFNPAWIKFILAYSEANNFTVNAIQAAPQVLGTPVAFEEFDIHPLTSPIITSATSVAYIWIFLVAGGSTYLVTHIVQPMTRGVGVAKTMTFMLLPLFLYMVVMSFCYSVLLLAFGVPFDGGVTQFIKMFAGMLMLQCSVAAMVLFLIFLIPVVYIPTITITFVILNVIAVFNPVELTPMVYRWVYAMPFLNAVQIARFVLMGSYNRLTYNIPILTAWILLPIILLPFAIKKQKRLAKEASLQEEDEARIEKDLRLQKQTQSKLIVLDHETD